MFVGDSVNDFKAFRLTGHGVLFRPRQKEYEKFAWRAIDNLSEIKKLIE